MAAEGPGAKKATTPEEDEKRHGLTPKKREAFILERSKYLLDELGKDLLTGLKNRAFFKEELERALKAIRGKEGHHRAAGEPLKELSLLFIDLDNFKQVNDTYGHLEGDNVLIKVAEILKDSVRAADVVARFGGDEFYVLLPRANERDAATIVDKIHTNLKKDPGLNKLGVTASIGIRSVDASNAADSETLIKHADIAMYKAKQEGKTEPKI